MSVKVRPYPRVYEIDASNFDDELEVLLDKLLGTKVEKNCDKPTVSGMQTANAYFLEIKLPGVTEENLEVHFESGNLTIQSLPDEGKDEETADERVISFSSRSRRRDNAKRYKVKPFRKIYRLPEDADPKGVSASFCDGVLSLQISKKVKIG